MRRSLDRPRGRTRSGNRKSRQRETSAPVSFAAASVVAAGVGRVLGWIDNAACTWVPKMAWPLTMVYQTDQQVAGDCVSRRRRRLNEMWNDVAGRV